MFSFFRYLGWCISILYLTSLYAGASHSDGDPKDEESHLLLPLMQQQSISIQQMEEGSRKKTSTIREEKSDSGLARGVSSNIGSMSVSGEAMGVGVNHGVIDARREDHHHSSNTISRVQGNVVLGDYFETNVYKNIEEPHKKLFEQMTRSTLEGLSRNPGLVLDFEVASRDFAETVGPGISSALYPTTLETYKRLANQSHPIALERYADHLIFAAQVKTDKDLIFNVCCLCCAKCSSDGMCKDAKSAYKDALKRYDPQSSHARLLRGKIEDVSVIANTINRQYCIRLSAYIIPPLLTISVVGGLAYYVISQY